MKNHYLAAAVATVLSLAACQKPAETEPTPAAAAAGSPAGSVAAVEHILALPALARCGAEAAGTNQVIDLGGGAFAVLADCEPSDSSSALKALFVQGADGVLKSQSLFSYHGPVQADGVNADEGLTSPLTWDDAAKELVSISTLGPDQGQTPAQTTTTKWRWDGSKIALVSAVVTGGGDVPPSWPTTPATPDPTPAAVPV